MPCGMRRAFVVFRGKGEEMGTCEHKAYNFTSVRKPMYATNGMVCTSQPLAAQAGLAVLREGGNAVDAAIATAITLTVTEPNSNGLGSDAFVLVWADGALHGLNGSGTSPQSLSLSAVKAGGYSAMPERGWIPVTVPGAPGAWAELHRRFGRLPFERLFSDAIRYAEEGYGVSPTTAKEWQEALQLMKPFAGKAPFAGFFDTFGYGGKAPKAGDRVYLPGHAKALRLLAESHCESLYRGELAKVIDEFSKATGGYITKDDLAAYHPEWQTPISCKYHGYDVWEMPPNTHGLVALMALAILDEVPCKQFGTADTVHKQIEALKQAYINGKAFITDPNHMSVSVEELLSPEYIQRLRNTIGDSAVKPKAVRPDSGGTVYLATADRKGMMVSFIQSNYMGFGSGIVIPGYGIALNDRGANFSLDEAHDNCLAGGKRPYHTIIPGFLTKDTLPVGPFGVMGAFMQPQGHVQAVMNMIDFAMNGQEALDAPRWQWIDGLRIEVEPGFGDDVVRRLKELGHIVKVNSDPTSFGRGQIIRRKEDGVLEGASEARADGLVAAY